MTHICATRPQWVNPWCYKIYLRILVTSLFATYIVQTHQVWHMYKYLYRAIPNYHLSDKNLPLMQTDWMLLTEDLLRKTVMYKWLKTDNPSYWLIVTAPALFCPPESTIHLGNSSMLVSSTYISHQYLTCVWLRMLKFETKNRDTIVDMEINQNPA